MPGKAFPPYRAGIFGFVCVAVTAVSIATSPALAQSGSASAPSGFDPSHQAKPKAVPKQDTVCHAWAKTGVLVKPIALEDLANRLANAELPKRELETTAEHAARIGPKIAQIAQDFSEPGQKLVVFAVPFDLDKFSYDADKQMASLSNQPGFEIIQRDISSGAIRARWSQKEVGTYDASNAFGAKLAVSKHLADELLVDFGVHRNILETMKRHRITFPLSRDRVPEVKLHLSAVFVGSLKAPYFSSGTTHLTPRFDFPHDYTTNVRTVHFALTCAAILDGTTSKIILPVSLSQL